MKKFLSILFVLVLALGLVACKKDDPTPVTPDPTPVTPDPDPVTPDPDPTEDTIQVPESLREVCLSATKIYLTCSGQSDQATVKNVIKKAGQKLDVNLTFGKDATSDIYEDNLLDADSVVDGSVVFLAVGGSNKGITGASSSETQELTRANKLAAKAADGKITLIVCHVGGAARRGELSDKFIKAAAPFATLLVVVSAGDTDGYFTTLSSSVPTVFADSAAALIPEFKALWSNPTQA